MEGAARLVDETIPVGEVQTATKGDEEIFPNVTGHPREHHRGQAHESHETYAEFQILEGRRAVGFEHAFL